MSIKRHHIVGTFNPQAEDPLRDLIDSLVLMRTQAFPAQIDWTTLRIEDGDSWDVYDWDGNSHTYAGPMHVHVQAMEVVIE